MREDDTGKCKSKKKLKYKLKYELVDFNGEIPWVKISKKNYMVDPLHEEKFNNTAIK